MVEQPAERPAKGGKTPRMNNAVKASAITALQEDEEIRFPTGMGELDRVLGGGAVKGSLVLDAGHGVEDGGAVSGGGVAESGINLQITRRLYEILRFLGHPAVMTRTGDDAIYDDSASTLREKKVSDLKNRTALANGTPNGLLISIHQNSLPGHPGVRGAQVFYNNVKPAQELAQTVQQALNSGVNEGRDKAAKPIGDGVYLMSHTTCPAILVECGFLSNSEETALLQQPSYQVKLAAVIAVAYCQYCTSEGIA